jgi:hypothetical protein
MSDYAWLVTEFADWTHRSDLSAKLATFITMAEAKINRRLNIAPKEIEVSMVTVPGSRFVVHPTDMSEPIALWITNSEPRRPIDWLLPTTLPVNNDLQGEPWYVAVDGANLAFEREADQVYPLKFRYVQDTGLSATNTTNTLIARSPDLYLFGVLTMASKYMQDDARAPSWKAEFVRCLEEVAAEQSRSKSVAPLQTDVPISFTGNMNRTRRY